MATASIFGARIGLDSTICVQVLGRKMRRCDLIVMDAGPLNMLAIADRLDLLLAVGLLVYIPDEVYFEAAEKFA